MQQEWTLWEREVLPQIHRALTTAVLLARDGEPLELHKLLQAGGQRYRRVLMLSPDFIVDDSGQAFLEEVNTNGFMIGDDEELWKAQADTVDMMRIAGADGWPKRKLYASQAAALVDGFLADEGYDEHDAGLVRPTLMALLNEEVAAQPTSWRLVFPSLRPAASSPHGGTGHYSEFATDLDDATTRFLQWRDVALAHEDGARYVETAAVNATAMVMLKERAADAGRAEDVDFIGGWQHVTPD